MFLTLMSLSYRNPTNEKLEVTIGIRRLVTASRDFLKDLTKRDKSGTMPRRSALGVAKILGKRYQKPASRYRRNGEPEKGTRPCSSLEQEWGSDITPNKTR